jgi:hypothetical protein
MLIAARIAFSFEDMMMALLGTKGSNRLKDEIHLADRDGLHWLLRKWVTLHIASKRTMLKGMLDTCLI